MFLYIPSIKQRADVVLSRSSAQFCFMDPLQLILVTAERETERSSEQRGCAKDGGRRQNDPYPSLHCALGASPLSSSSAPDAGLFPDLLTLGSPKPASTSLSSFRPCFCDDVHTNDTVTAARLPSTPPGSCQSLSPWPVSAYKPLL